MNGAIAGAVAGITFLLLVVFGWRTMQRSNREKAAVLSSLLGSEVVLNLHAGSGSPLVLHRCLLVRLDRNGIVVREPDAGHFAIGGGVTIPGDPAALEEDHVFPLAAIRQVWVGDQTWGPW